MVRSNLVVLRMLISLPPLEAEDSPVYMDLVLQDLLLVIMVTEALENLVVQQSLQHGTLMRSKCSSHLRVDLLRNT